MKGGGGRDELLIICSLHLCHLARVMAERAPPGNTVVGFLTLSVLLKISEGEERFRELQRVEAECIILVTTGKKSRDSY